MSNSCYFQWGFNADFNTCFCKTFPVGNLPNDARLILKLEINAIHDFCNINIFDQQ